MASMALSEAGETMGRGREMDGSSAARIRQSRRDGKCGRHGDGLVRWSS
jgi:hypothetical protein